MPVSKRQYSTVALVTSIAAAVCDFGVTTIIGFLYKNYNALTDSQSDLGAHNSPVAIYMNTWEVLLGLLLLTCSRCLYKTGFFKSGRQKLALWLLAIYGLGEGIGSGLFSFDHVNHKLTLTGWVHSVFSGIGITAMVILSFVLVGLFSKKNAPRLHGIFFWCAMVGAVFIILCLLSRRNFIDFVGLWQRGYIGAYYVMLIVLTSHVHKVAKKTLS